MKLIYIAGAYRAKTAYERQRNINAAWKAGAELIAHPCNNGEFFPIIPHMNTANMDGLESDEYFLAGTMETMTRCDGVWNICKGWPSEGVRGEIVRAVKINMPIFRDVEDVFYYDWGMNNEHQHE